MYQIRTSFKLKEIMKKILLLGNTLNQGTARGNNNFAFVSSSFIRVYQCIKFLHAFCMYLVLSSNLPCKLIICT
jgi:hypothetical protein